MVAVMDIKAELAKLTTLQGPTPETPAAEREGSFARLAPCRDGAIFTSKFPAKALRSAIRTATKSCRSSTAQQRCTS